MDIVIQLAVLKLICKIIEPSKILYNRFRINVAEKLFLFDFGQVFVVQTMKSAVDLAHG